MQHWKSYKYKNFTFLALSLLLTIFLIQNKTFHALLFHLGTFGYLGAFIGGALFVSTFTVSIGTAILLILAENYSPVFLGIIAGLGAVAGDLTIFQFVHSRGFVEEVKHLFEFFGSDKIHHLLHTKYFSWTLPVVGALIIASPLPDELGVSLMGISRMKPYQFILLSFGLNSLGIFLILTASNFIRP